MAGIRKREWITKKGIKKSCYEVTYYVNGKPLRKSGFSTKEKAQLAVKELKENYNENIKFNMLARGYINEHCKIHCKKSTLDLYNSYLNNHVDEINNLKLADIKVKHLNKIIAHMQDKNLKHKTINDVLTFISSIFNYAIDNEIMSKNPCQKIKKLKKEHREMAFLNEDEVNKVLGTCKQTSPKFYPLLYTAIFTGMRRGELLALEWSDIDLDNKKINVTKTVYQGEATDPKTYTSNRKINITEKTTEVLKEHKRNRSEVSKIVFCNTFGKYQHAWDMVDKRFKPILKACNLSVRFHDLRHTYASLLLSKNIPINYVSKQLGHASCKMTLDRYGHLMPDVNERAVNILDEIVDKSEHEMSMKN